MGHMGRPIGSMGHMGRPIGSMGHMGRPIVDVGDIPIGLEMCGLQEKCENITILHENIEGTIVKQ